MSHAERFLTTLAQALSTSALYDARHPLRMRVLGQGYDRLQDLLGEMPDPVFTFLDDAVLFDGRPLRSFQAWMWAERLTGVGIQRIEVVGSPSKKDYIGFVDDLCRRLSGEGSGEDAGSRAGSFRYGAVGIASGEQEGSLDLETGPMVDVVQTVGFLDEAAVVEWVFGEAREGRDLQMLEVDMVARALGATMRGGVDFLIPILRLEGYDAFTTVHSLNVAILAMAFGEYLGLDRQQIHVLGVSGILHDLGKTRVPSEVLEKTSGYTDDEWALIRAHPAEGARMILESDERLDVAAVVAYEHHMTFDGGGYPRPSQPRKCHPLSHLVQLCDAYDTLASPRPPKQGLSKDQILAALRRGSGTAFDPHLCHGFQRMIEEWADRMRIFTAAEAETLLEAGV